METAVVKKAKEILKNPDMLVDLYDFTIVWMSPWLEKILGYGKEKLVGKELADYFAVDDAKKREKVFEHISKTRDHLTADLKTKGGNIVRFEVEFHTFEFNKGFYHVGKSIKHEKILKKNNH